MWQRIASWARRRHHGSGVQIPPDLWAHTLAAYPFLAWRDPQSITDLQTLCGEFLARKEFNGVHGFEVTDEVALAVAAQACLPVLRLGLDWYDGFVGIVMHEGPVRTRRVYADDDGLVHEFEEELVGEATDGGPLMLCWHSGAAPADAAPTAFNVVIHEFVHLIDLRDGLFDGAPPLPPSARARWLSTMQAALDRFDERQACGYDSVLDG